MFALLKICVLSTLFVTIIAKPVAESTDSKHVSLQNLIGNIEKSMVRSAISVGSIVDDSQALVDEVRPEEGTGHDVSKRSTVEEPIALPSTIQETKVEVTPTPEVVLQTTENVPELIGSPHHILIDRISVQPHNGGVPFIPTFEVHHTKLTSKVGDQSQPIGDGTQISISKTVITTTVKKDEESKPAAEIVPAIKDETVSSSPVVPVEKLNQAELELKEKVAEIEANPVILSTRI